MDSIVKQDCVLIANATYEMCKLANVRPNTWKTRIEHCLGNSNMCIHVHIMKLTDWSLSVKFTAIVNSPNLKSRSESCWIPGQEMFADGGLGFVVKSSKELYQLLLDAGFVEENPR